MFSKSSKKSSKGWCQFCLAVRIIIGVIAVIAALFALVGVYKAHFLSTGLTFGTIPDSMALVALAFNLFLVKKITGFCCCGQCSVK
ncbi:MAG TPA: hypothetical protein VHA78_04405 [Candidatus Peribacteraceae bacterium]|nr:hypothetical protein [Candidatus Peribacteraceae bacterium]